MSVGRLLRNVAVVLAGFIALTYAIRAAALLGPEKLSPVADRLLERGVMAVVTFYLVGAGAWIFKDARKHRDEQKAEDSQ